MKTDSRLKILSVIGTRPEAIKMAPVIQELEKYPDRIHSLVCVTGQHREMLDQVLASFKISPNFDLNLMRQNQKLSQLTSDLLSKLDSIIDEVRPDWILAQGDTTTVLAASLVAFYRQISFGHVEAGLRTGDLSNPFPEEMNRRLADILAALAFAPTERSRQVLLREGYPESKIRVTGNTVVDALNSVVRMPCSGLDRVLAGIPSGKRLVLITAHRRESFGDTFREMCLALRDIALDMASVGVHLVYPVHLNPNVQKPVREILSEVANVHLIEPLDYISLVHLMKRSMLILTDSGGIQEEAPSLGVPVLIMRNTTERPEGVEAGVARLVGTTRERIRAESERLLSDEAARSGMVREINPYGDGKAASRIVTALLEF